MINKIILFSSTNLKLWTSLQNASKISAQGTILSYPRRYVFVLFFSEMLRNRNNL